MKRLTSVVPHLKDLYTSEAPPYLARLLGISAGIPECGAGHRRQWRNPSSCHAREAVASAES
jgi:hypothetical protein